uniref:Uncharacterized protein n=1 Tax=Rhizophora mucronata TaxID=61149 RepID=A0A2P2Q259_RHIMU
MSLEWFTLKGDIWCQQWNLSYSTIHYQDSIPQIRDTKSRFQDHAQSH